MMCFVINDKLAGKATQVSKYDMLLQHNTQTATAAMAAGYVASGELAFALRPNSVPPSTLHKHINKTKATLHSHQPLLLNQQTCDDTGQLEACLSNQPQGCGPPVLSATTLSRTWSLGYRKLVW